jgi:hypothetical protein
VVVVVAMEKPRPSREIAGVAGVIFALCIPVHKDHVEVRTVRCHICPPYPTRDHRPPKRRSRRQAHQDGRGEAVEDGKADEQMLIQGPALGRSGAARGCRGDRRHGMRGRMTAAKNERATEIASTIAGIPGTACRLRHPRRGQCLLHPRGHVGRADHLAVVEHRRAFRCRAGVLHPCLAYAFHAVSRSARAEHVGIAARDDQYAVVADRQRSAASAFGCGEQRGALLRPD